MCTVEHARSIVICDVAIGQVRQELTEHFSSGVTFSVVADKGTRVQADPTVDAQQFTQVVKCTIAVAQSPGQA